MHWRLGFIDECSEGVAGFGVLEALTDLEASYWQRHAGCRHYKVINKGADARTSARAVAKLFELTS